MAALKKCVGADLGTNTVKLVELVADKNGVRVSKAAMKDIGADPSMPGEERRALIARAFRDLVKETKVSTKNAIFALPGQKVFIRRFRLPETTQERLERIVRYEARQQIPFPLEKTDLQYQFFPIPEENEVEVLLVAVRHEEVGDFMGMVDKAALKPRAVGVSSFALFNTHAFLNRSAASLAGGKNASPKKEAKKGGGLGGLLKRGKKGAAETPAETPEGESFAEEFAFEEVKGFINIGAAATDLVIARQQGDKSLPGFFRSFPVAGNEMTREIMEECAVQSFHDAEAIKRSQTRLMTFDFDFEDESAINRQACSAATDAMDRQINELRRSLDFYITQPDGQAVDTLILSGGGALMPGADTYIEEKLTIGASVLRDVPEESILKWPDSAGPITTYAVATGLALQGLGHSALTVDFLPQDRKILRDFPYKTAAILGVLLLGIVFFTAQAGVEDQKDFRSGADGIRNLVATNQVQKNAETEAVNQNASAAGQYETFAKGINDRDYVLDFLAEVNRAKPPEVLVDSVSIDFFGNFRIVGLSEEQRSAADFVTALKRSELLKEANEEANLGNVAPVQDRRYPERRAVSKFEITGQVSNKINALEVTPTPAPTPTSGPSGFEGGGGVRPGQPSGPVQMF